MIERILTAIDNSTLSDHVFAEALSLAKLSHAQLLLLHVLSDEEIGYPDVHNLAEHLGRWEEYKQRGLELLQLRRKTATEAGVTTSLTQTPGTSGRTICEVAREWGADVIVVGHRGRSGLGELLQGSVSNYLVHHSPCSVLTTLGQEKPAFQQILVAIDGSVESRQAFNVAMDLARISNADLHLLHVLSVEDKGSPSLFSLRDPDFERKWEVFAQPSMDLLRSHQAIADAAGIPTTLYQKLGSNPGRVICELAHSLPTDLIVVGRRGLSGLNELFMGSVSNYVTHYAPCSVLTVQGQVKSSPPVSSENRMASTC
jgi:nucleotide-binding universal stress UspA family protein